MYNCQGNSSKKQSVGVENPPRTRFDFHYCVVCPIAATFVILSRIPNYCLFRMRLKEINVFYWLKHVRVLNIIIRYRISRNTPCVFVQCPIRLCRRMNEVY